MSTRDEEPDSKHRPIPSLRRNEWERRRLQAGQLLRQQQQREEQRRRQGQGEEERTSRGRGRYD
jgi:hypothetical protein